MALCNKKCREKYYFEYMSINASFLSIGKKEAFILLILSVSKIVRKVIRV